MQRRIHVEVRPVAAVIPLHHASKIADRHVRRRHIGRQFCAWARDRRLAGPGEELVRRHGLMHPRYGWHVGRGAPPRQGLILIWLLEHGGRVFIHDAADVELLAHALVLLKAVDEPHLPLVHALLV